MTTEFFNKEILDKMECSKELLNFYLAYKEWLDKGAPDGDDIFLRNTGLCTNLVNYCCWIELEQSRFTIVEEMHHQFEEFGLSEIYPFNGSRGVFEYEEESQRGTCHLNDKRAAWIIMWTDKYKGVSNDNN